MRYDPAEGRYGNKFTSKQIYKKFSEIQPWIGKAVLTTLIDTYDTYQN